MRGAIKRLTVLTGLLTLLVFALAAATAAGAHLKAHQSGVVGTVKFCGDHQPGRPLCRSGGSGRVTAFRSQEGRVKVARMRHGRFSIRLHPGRYQVMLTWGTGYEYTSRAFSVAAHHKTRITIKIKVKSAS